MTPHEQALQSLTESLSPASEERLAEVLEQYLRDIEAGRPVDTQQLLGEHADLAGPLGECLSGLRLLREAAAEFRIDDSTAPPHRQLPFERLGDFQIVREIGRGGMGVVYEAQQISLNRRVALKVLPFPALLDEKQIARFSNEARAAAQLQHAHIVPVFSVGSEGGVHFFSMQYIDGDPLSRIIGRQRAGAAMLSDSGCESAPTQAAIGSVRPSASTGPVVRTTCGSQHRGHWRRIAELAIQAADALHYAHQCGVVHRDVKPSNLLLDRTGKLWVADFGLARCRTDSSLTTTGGVLGTVNYMSPEQASGDGPVDHRTDIYSLGITFYELLTLHRAFAGRDRHDVLRRIAEDDPVRPRKLDPAIPVDLETIVLKATARSPQQRYATARHLADDLQRFLDGRPILATRATLADRLWKWAGRHRTLVRSGLALLLVAMVSMGVATMMIARAQSKTRAALVAVETALEDKAEALKQSERDRQRSEQWFRQARDVLNRLAKRHAEELRELPQAEGLRRRLLSDSIQYYQSFIRGAEDDPALRADLAVAYFQTGKLLERLPETEEALAAYRNAQDSLERLSKEHPEELDVQADVALCHNNIGLLLLETRTPEDAEAALSRAVAIQRRLAEQSPGTRRFRYELALSLGNLGTIHQRRGDSRSAVASYEESLGLCEELVKECPSELRYLSQLALTSNDFGLLVSDAEPGRAERLCHQAQAAERRLVELCPKESEYQADLALCHSNLGSLERRLGKSDAAEKSYREAIAVYRRLSETAPAVGRYRCELATALSDLGALYLQTGQAARANEAFQDSRKTLTHLVDELPEVVNYRSYLGGVLNNQGTALTRLDRTAEAEEAYRQGIQHQRYAVEHAPQSSLFRRLLANQYLILSRFLREQHRTREVDALELAARELQAPAR